MTVDGVFAATQISIADSALTLNSGFDTSTTTVSIEVGAFNAENAALVLDSSAVGTAPAISISGDVNALTEARYLVATGFDDLAAFSLEESLAEDYLLRAVDGNIYLYNADAPYFTTELSVTQAEGASVDGNYTFTANFEAEGLLLTGYTLKLYDSATATTPIDEITLGADVVGQEFTFANTVQNFWISVTANGENGQSTDSPTSGRLEVAVQDHDSPVILSVTSDAKSDSVTLACEATDNFGVTGYEFILDGQSLGVQSGSQLALDISNLAAGTHSYTVNVYDAAGNLAGSAEQSFEFTPVPGPGPEPTVPASFLYSSQVRPGKQRRNGHRLRELQQHRGGTRVPDRRYRRLAGLRCRGRRKRLGKHDGVLPRTGDQRSGGDRGRCDGGSGRCGTQRGGHSAGAHRRHHLRSDLQLRGRRLEDGGTPRQYV